MFTHSCGHASPVFLLLCTDHSSDSPSSPVHPSQTNSRLSTGAALAAVHPRKSGVLGISVLWPLSDGSDRDNDNHLTANGSVGTITTCSSVISTFCSVRIGRRHLLFRLVSPLSVLLVACNCYIFTSPKSVYFLFLVGGDIAFAWFFARLFLPGSLIMGTKNV